MRHDSILQSSHQTANAMLQVIMLLIYDAHNLFPPSTSRMFLTNGTDRTDNDRLRHEIQYHDEPSAESQGHVAYPERPAEGDDQSIHASPALGTSRVPGNGSEWRSV